MTENIMLEILSAFIHNRRPSLSDDVPEDKVFYFFYTQGILPILAYMDKKWDFIKDETTKRKLSEFYYHTIAMSFNKADMFENISQRLSENDIPHMPVKGWYIRTLYPVPELRTFGDIDILINKQDRQKADEIFIQNGYTLKDNWEPTYSYHKGALTCEVHTELMDSDIGKGEQVVSYFSDALETAQRELGERYSPRNDLHLMYLICHLAKHLYNGGAGIRMYMDIALFVSAHGDTLDLPKLYEDSKSLHLDRFFKTALSACREWFGIDLPLETNDVDPASLDELKKYTFSADLFGKSRDKSIISLRNEQNGSKEAVLRDALFPDAQKIEERYKFVKGRRYLLPVAWAVRGVVNLKKIPQKLRYMKNVSDADMSAVNEYDEFITKIGL